MPPKNSSKIGAKAPTAAQAEAAQEPEMVKVRFTDKFSYTPPTTPSASVGYKEGWEGHVPRAHADAAFKVGKAVAVGAAPPAPAAPLEKIDGQD